MGLVFMLKLPKTTKKVTLALIHLNKRFGDFKVYKLEIRIYT